jgi:hypothetical protein
MDRFDLKWPKTDATFYTDGWRCRIVWRQKGGMGGTIENNAQCVQRLAQSLDGAPYLLGALKARGHDRLATEIESLVEREDKTPVVETVAAADRAVGTSVKRPARAEKPGVPKAAPRRADPAERLAKWVDGLEGAADFEPASNRRAKTWIELGELGDENLLLKTPAAKGKQEWVLKRTWSDGRKAEYVAAPAFKGIARHLLEARATAAFMEALLGACEGVKHDELHAAANGWRSVMDGATH